MALTVVAVLAIIAFGGMSYWQWQRATEQDDAVAQPTVPVSQVLTADAAPDPSAYGTPVVVRGAWDPDRQVLIDHGNGGFWVVTPVLPPDGPAVPVARATVTSPDDPAVAPPTGAVVVTGLAQPFEGEPGTTSAPVDGVTDRLTAVGLDLPYEHVQGWVSETSQEPAPAVAAVPVNPPFGGQGTDDFRLRNAGYALQWIVFAAFVVFVWLRWLRLEASELDGPAAPEGASDAGGATAGPPGAGGRAAPEVY
jgi:cytochrome oxidase assembly protein ShyY1